MSELSTHILDLVRGTPARGVAVRLSRLTAAGAWETLADRITDDDGRVKDFLAGGPLLAGRYLMTFAAGAYFKGQGTQGFHPEVPVIFDVSDPSRRLHVPLLLSPFGYSTYRGS